MRGATELHLLDAHPTAYCHRSRQKSFNVVPLKTDTPQMNMTDTPQMNMTCLYPGEHLSFTC